MEEKIIDLKQIVSEKIGKPVKIVYCKPIYKNGEFQYIDIRAEVIKGCDIIENTITISKLSDFENLPKTLSQTVNYVISKTTKEDRKIVNEFINADEFANSLRLTTIPWFRNNLELWDNKNPLYIFLKNKYKITHPDDMTHLIFVHVFNKLKKKK